MLKLIFIKKIILIFILNHFCITHTTPALCENFQLNLNSYLKAYHSDTQQQNGKRIHSNASQHLA